MVSIGRYSSGIRLEVDIHAAQLKYFDWHETSENRPKTDNSVLEKPNRRNRPFGNFEFCSVFRKPETEILIGFRTALICSRSSVRCRVSAGGAEVDVVDGPSATSRLQEAPDPQLSLGACGVPGLATDVSAETAANLSSAVVCSAVPGQLVSSR